MERWFVDTAYVLALASKRDALNSRAEALKLQIKKERIELVTTQAVLLEIATVLRSARYRTFAVAFIEEFQHSSFVVSLSTDLLSESWEMYKRHADKEWSWVDTISFVVMRREGMREALTSDHHFEQASFRALLVADEAS